MNPVVWGPVLWRMLFCIAWNSVQDDMALVRELFVVLLPRLLPCHDCRFHMLSHKDDVDRAAGVRKSGPRNPTQAFRWLYHLKDAVNRKTTPPVRSISMDDLLSRYRFFDVSATNEVELADVLVLVAMEAASLGREKDYDRFCAVVAILLPASASFKRSLSECGAQDVIEHAARVADTMRQEAGLPTLTLEHYKKYGS